MEGTSTEAAESVNTQPEQIGFWQAFFTQSDLSSRCCRETWYGYHAPWLRLLVFCLLASFCSTVGDLVQFQFMNIPILTFMRDEQLQELREIHYACPRALCRAVQTLHLDCIVNDDGRSARLDYEAYQGPDIVPVPEECYVAFEKTFGDEFFSSPQAGNDTVIMDRNLVFFDLRSYRGGHVSKNHLTFIKIMPECAIQFLSDVSQRTELTPLVDFEQAKAGERKTIPLKHLTCPSDMPEHVRNDILPIVDIVYEYMLTHRHLVFAVGSFSFWFLSNILAYVGPFLLLLTVLIRWILPWPTDYIDHKRVTFWSTWHMLMLLFTLSSQRSGNVGDALLTAVLFTGALVVGNQKAARSWIDLAVLWFGAPNYLYPLLDRARDFVAMFDALNIVKFVGSLLSFFIVGTDWWKLVTLYVFYRAYPLREEWLERRLFGRGGNDAHASTNNDQDTNDAHLKLD